MKDKKYVFITGTLCLPLKVDARALVFHKGSCTHTSPVQSIHEVTQDYILFETETHVYRISTFQALNAASMTRMPEQVCA